jgi:hypothetical protein
MITVAGGDSFVWGSELADSPHGGTNGYSKKTFAALLSGEKYICAAYPGIGNCEIVDRVIHEMKYITCNRVLISWTWSTRDNKDNSDDEIILMQSYLNERSIPYLFTCADNCIVTKNPDIDWSKWFLFPPIPYDPNNKPKGFYQWAVENKYPLAPRDKHPLEKAHQDAYLLMKGRFDELVKTNV